MAKVQSVCVYCGSKTGRNKAFAKVAEDFGRILGNNQKTMVYGGGSIGLMGITARSTIKHGGDVIGIIPEHLDSIEIGQKGLKELHVVPNMHIRKRQMFDVSDSFVSLPGSIGTLDETIEVITWKQLNLHDKPIIIVNADGYWTPFLDMLDNIIDEEFCTPETRDLFHVVDSVDDVLDAIKAQPEPVIDPKNTLF